MHFDWGRGLARAVVAGGTQLSQATSNTLQQVTSEMSLFLDALAGEYDRDNPEAKSSSSHHRGIRGRHRRAMGSGASRQGRNRQASSSSASTKKTRRRRAAAVPARSPRPLDVTQQVLEFAAALSAHPDTFIKFPQSSLPPITVASASCSSRWISSLSSDQVRHARELLAACPQFCKLRYQLCPSKIPEKTFWRVYFCLLANYLRRKKRTEEERRKAAKGKATAKAKGTAPSPSTDQQDKDSDDDNNNSQQAGGPPADEPSLNPLDSDSLSSAVPMATASTSAAATLGATASSCTSGLGTAQGPSAASKRSLSPTLWATGHEYRSPYTLSPISREATLVPPAPISKPVFFSPSSASDHSDDAESTWKHSFRIEPDYISKPVQLPADTQSGSLASSSAASSAMMCSSASPSSSILCHSVDDSSGFLAVATDPSLVMNEHNDTNQVPDSASGSMDTHEADNPILVLYPMASSEQHPAVAVSADADDDASDEFVLL